MQLDRENIGRRVQVAELKEHLARYLFASDYIKDNLRVLDCACGVGYGSYLLSKKNPSCSVLGIDKDAEAIQYAKRHFHSNNVRFIQSDIFDYKFERRYDCIVSFEMIEHVVAYERLLQLFRSQLKKGGVLIVSSPNSHLMSPNLQRPLSRYHVREFELVELKNILKNYFPHVDAFVQRHAFNGTIVRFRQTTSQAISHVSDGFNRQYLNAYRVLNNLARKKEFVVMKKKNVSKLFSSALRHEICFPTPHHKQSKLDYLFEVFVCRTA